MIANNKCIITHICGGLGNQMFQHAAGRALTLCHGVQLLWDISWYNCMEGCTPRTFMLPLFPTLSLGQEGKTVLIAENKDIAPLKFAPQSAASKLWYRLRRQPAPYADSFIQEPQPHYCPEIKYKIPPVYLQGYWQDERYFMDYAVDIAADFTFPPLPEAAKAMAEDIKRAKNASSVHIRRGDYVHSAVANSVHGTCSTEYYRNAFTMLKKNYPDVHLFLFSDDAPWVRENFDTSGLPCTVVNLHPEFAAHHDMHLMTLCKHHVIANSSFSWWGAWLAKKNGITICPKQWFSATSKRHQNPCPARWVRI